MNKIRSYFVDNTFEKYEFTKIELFLLIGCVLLYFPVLSDALSPEIKIYYAGAISMFLFIFIMILSRSGLTSYTPWLEKLANDKLETDMKFFQYIHDETENYTKLKEFFIANEDKEGEWEDNAFEDIENSRELDGEGKKKAILERKKDILSPQDFFGSRPVNDNDKWYSVFTERLDYKFYEIFFIAIYYKWMKDNYGKETDDEGNVLFDEDGNPILSCGIPKNHLLKLKNNPELTPTKTNSVVKDELTKDNDRLLKKILGNMEIFNQPVSNELKKILIKKIQIDLTYFAVMVNFRRGLENATIDWISVEEELKQLEKVRISTEAKNRDESAKALESKVREIIDNVKGVIHGNKHYMSNRNQVKTSQFYEDLKAFEEKIEKGDLLDASEQRHYKLLKDFAKCKSNNDEDEVKEKIEKIQDKLLNRNDWESPEWRAMGSIYYKWKEAAEDNEKGIEEAGRTALERWNDFKLEHQKGIKKKVKFDPIEEAWKNNRTIRAVNSLVEKFGAGEKKKAGKAIVFFGVVFGLIIAVALTNALDIVIETTQLPVGCEDFKELVMNEETDTGILSEDCYHAGYDIAWANVVEYPYLIILFLCFFPIGILFYHSGTIFLSEKAAENITSGNKLLILFNFITILLQAIVIYFLASSIGDPEAFLNFLMALVIIDIAWVATFTINDLRDEVRDAPVFLEWIMFDIIIAIFALIFMQNYEQASDIMRKDGEWVKNIEIFLILLIVLSTRAVVDYSYAWKNFWSLFADAE